MVEWHKITITFLSCVYCHGGSNESDWIEGKPQWKMSKLQKDKKNLQLIFLPLITPFTKSQKNCSQLKISQQIKIIFPSPLNIVVKWRCKKVEASSFVTIKQYWHLIKITRRIKDSFDVNFGGWSPEEKNESFCFFMVYYFTMLLKRKARWKLLNYFS